MRIASTEEYMLTFIFLYIFSTSNILTTMNPEIDNLITQ
jgi:hypothetical protein